jgi:hypothetical protein
MANNWFESLLSWRQRHSLFLFLYEKKIGLFYHHAVWTCVFCETIGPVATYGVFAPCKNGWATETAISK